MFIQIASSPPTTTSIIRTALLLFTNNASLKTVMPSAHDCGKIATTLHPVQGQRNIHESHEATDHLDRLGHINRHAHRLISDPWCDVLSPFLATQERRLARRLRRTRHR